MGGRRFSRRCSENTQAAHHRFRSPMRGREVAHGSFSKRLQTRLRHARRVAGALPRARARRRRDGVVTAVIFAVIFIVAGSIPGVRRVCQAFFRAGVPNFHRSGIEEAGIEEAGCMKRPAGKNRRPPGGRHSSQILPPGGRRLFCAMGFIPMDEGPSENRYFLPGRPRQSESRSSKGAAFQTTADDTQEADDQRWLFSASSAEEVEEAATVWAWASPCSSRERRTQTRCWA